MRDLILCAALCYTALRCVALCCATYAGFCWAGTATIAFDKDLHEKQSVWRTIELNTADGTRPLTRRQAQTGKDIRTVVKVQLTTMSAGIAAGTATAGSSASRGIGGGGRARGKPGGASPYGSPYGGGQPGSPRRDTRKSSGPSTPRRKQQQQQQQQQQQGQHVKAHVSAGGLRHVAKFASLGVSAAKQVASVLRYVPGEYFGCGKRRFAMPFCTKPPNICPDRLGTNTGKVESKETTFLSAGSLRRPVWR